MARPFCIKNATGYMVSSINRVTWEEFRFASVMDIKLADCRNNRPCNIRYIMSFWIINCNTYSLSKTSNDPVTSSNWVNDIRRKIADGIAQAINNFFKSRKDLIMKTLNSQFFPYLLNGIHFRCVRRNEYDLNIRPCLKNRERWTRAVPWNSNKADKVVE